jgi:hypothetical protein
MIANRSAVFYRDLNKPPPTIVRGEGVFLFDSEGRRYLDGSASASVVGIGHGRREIWEALAAAGDAVTFVYGATFTHPWQERLAAAILALAPPEMAAVYFTSGGSEANESAWKLARQYFVETGRPQKYKVSPAGRAITASRWPRCRCRGAPIGGASTRRCCCRSRIFRRPTPTDASAAPARDAMPPVPTNWSAPS